MVKSADGESVESRLNCTAEADLNIVVDAVPLGAAFDAKEGVGLDLFLEAVVEGACAEAGR